MSVDWLEHQRRLHRDAGFDLAADKLSAILYDRPPFRATVEVVAESETETFTGVFFPPPEDVRRSFGQMAKAEIARVVLVGFEDVIGDGDVPVPFSTDAVDALLAMPLVDEAVVRAYRRAIRSAPGPGVPGAFNGR